jgi:hypothetical protein
MKKTENRKRETGNLKPANEAETSAMTGFLFRISGFPFSILFDCSP